jgi:hypothetical protein
VAVSVAFLGAVAGGIYGGVTWHPVCSPEDSLQIFCSRSDRIVFDALKGLLVGALVGLVVGGLSTLWPEIKAEVVGEGEERPAEEQRRGPGGEPEPDADPEPDVTGPPLD